MDQIRIAADSSCDLLTMTAWTLSAFRSPSVLLWRNFAMTPRSMSTRWSQHFAARRAAPSAPARTSRTGSPPLAKAAMYSRSPLQAAFRAAAARHLPQRNAARSRIPLAAFCGGHAVRRSGDRPAHRKVSRRTALRQELRGGLHSRTAVSAPYPSALCAGIHAQSRPERTNQQAGGNDGRCSRHPCRWAGQRGGHA